VAADVFGESQALAQLLHTNIVPVYSVHRAGALQAVCMPYLGATTLADVLKNVRNLDRLPHSGTALVSTLLNRLSTYRQSTVTGGEPADPAAAEFALAFPPPPDRPPPILAMLEGLDYVHAVLWVVARLADGLAHAHEHGILHRDIKPANVLLSDEGQPMLLDFGVAEDMKLGTGAAAALVGGTLPYMAPEHLDACRNPLAGVTAQSDIYSLGVIMFELLTGRHPFPAPRGCKRDDVGRMIADRNAPLPAIRDRNRSVTPAVESIVRRCLRPDPALRYQTARELQEDLQRHLQNLPLRYAPEPSLRERARKWRKRHPKLTSSTSVAVLGLVLVAGATGLAVVRGQRLAALEATQSFAAFRDEARSAQLLLTARAEDRRQVDEGMVWCRRALDHYQVLDNPGWEDAPSVRRLPAAERQELRQAAAELMLLLARANALGAAPGKDEEAVRLALGMNERAAAVCPDEGLTRALWAQRAELSRLLGKLDDARALREKAEKVPLRTARDRYLAAAEYSASGRFREAVPLLQEAVAQDPKQFWPWFVLGYCHAGLGQSADAVACYSAAIALWPEFPWTHFNRGLVFQQQQHNYQRAAADFGEAARLRPELVEPLLHRALARQGLKDYAGAAEDLTRALGLDRACTKAYFMRARVHDLAGDAAAAKRDRDEGMRHTPTDEPGWVARGLARLGTDLPGALSDFEKALELNPSSLSALQDRAHALGRLGRNADAARTLDRALDLYPDFVLARAGRGVYRARLGDRPGALEDAREALLRDVSPSNVYQVAGIYALTSQKSPDDRREAFRLLSQALRQGFGFEFLEIDPELSPIRQEPEFRRLVEAARAFRTAAAPAR
jgi:tetratricopeptide (TPR) repeat protein